MSGRTQEEIEIHIKQVMDEHVAPAVAEHNGKVNFISYVHGQVLLELSGACSGCAGSTETLKYGIEETLMSHVEEVTGVEGFDDPNSEVDPYFSETYTHTETYTETYTEYYGVANGAPNIVESGRPSSGQSWDLIDLHSGDI